MPKRSSDTRTTSDGEPLGLQCRNCGCRHFLVVYTRPGRNGAIVRRRQCRHCGRRITTRESAK